MYNDNERDEIRIEGEKMKQVNYTVVIPLAKLINYYGNLETVLSSDREKLKKEIGPVANPIEPDELDHLKHRIKINSDLVTAISEFFRNKAVEVTVEEARNLLGDILPELLDSGVVKKNKIFI